MGHFQSFAIKSCKYTYCGENRSLSVSTPSNSHFFGLRSSLLVNQMNKKASKIKSKARKVK